MAGIALTLLARPRRLLVTLAGVVAATAGPIGWNAILHATHASEFFTDAPIRLLPASWQDTGSGVLAFAAAVIPFGLGPCVTRPLAAPWAWPRSAAWPPSSSRSTCTDCSRVLETPVVWEGWGR